MGFWGVCVYKYIYTYIYIYIYIDVRRERERERESGGGGINLCSRPRKRVPSRVADRDTMRVTT